MARKTKLKASLVIAATLIGGVYLWNASWLAPKPENPEVKLIAHRGVHQTFDRTDLGSNDCTATRIAQPTHNFLENTIGSMAEAFATGADVVEIDVHPTTDGHFAVFHDWTLDCRTEGEGVTRRADLAYIKTLDPGFGYTADDGESFPLRGQTGETIPSLEEVFAQFPDRKFLVNYKSRELFEGEMLAETLSTNPQWRNAVWAVYGGDVPTYRAVELVDGLKGFGSRATRDCLIKYLALGWSGYVPENCRNTYVMVPANLAWAAWGWPHRFHERLRAVNSEIILIGPYTTGDPGTSGIDDLSQMDMIPDDFNGYLWTNKIEVVGPAIEAGALQE